MIDSSQLKNRAILEAPKKRSGKRRGPRNDAGDRTEADNEGGGSVNVNSPVVNAARSVKSMQPGP
jgi:hypothetical protein